ncbi:MAG: hypothetical protein HFG34_07230 [Eubacterium sp.]|nr:hypothetical protein [Eubacterium sp.]
MSNQFLFVINDIRKNKVYFSWNVIQISIVCVLLSIILQSAFEYRDVKDKFDKITEQSEIYMFRDETTDEKFEELLNDENKLHGLAELYDTVQKSVKASQGDILSFTANSNKRFYMSDELAKDIAQIWKVPEETRDSLDMISVSENFFQIFQLKIEGDLDQFKKKAEGKIPVIVGNSFHKMYQLHDVIYDSNHLAYEIAGFLEEGSYYIAPGESREPVYLDQVILKLSEIDPEDSVDLLDYFVTTYYIIKDNDFMENVVEQSRDKDLMDLSMNNFSFQMDAITEDIKDEMILNGSIMVILFIFCLIAMTGNILQFISDAKREFAVHMMCGANKGAIVFRIIMQMWCIYISSAVFVILIKKASKTTFMSLAFSGVYILLLCLLPIWILKRQTIQTLYKKSYE